jgi:hypothetical protein
MVKSMSSISIDAVPDTALGTTEEVKLRPIKQALAVRAISMCCYLMVTRIVVRFLKAQSLVKPGQSIFRLSFPSPSL